MWKSAEIYLTKKKKGRVHLRIKERTDQRASCQSWVKYDLQGRTSSENTVTENNPPNEL